MSSLKLSETLKDKLSYIIFLILVYAVAGVFIQTFTKTPFLTGGRGSIEYLYITGYAEGFGYSRLYTTFTLLSLALNSIFGDMILSVKASAIIFFVIYLFSLYILSSTFSTKWCALAVALTAFLSNISDTVYKGNYMLFTSIVFTTIFLTGLYNFIQKPSRRFLAAAVVALALIPFSDPKILPWLSIPILSTILFSTISSDRRLIPHFILMATVYAATSTFSATVFVGLKDSLWQPNPITQFSSNILVSAALTVAGALGLIALYRRGYRKLSYSIILWLCTSTAASIFEPNIFSFTIPVLSALAPASLTYLYMAFSLKRIGDDNEVQYEVEVSLDRLTAALPAIFLTIMLLLAVPSTIILGDHEMVPPARVEDIRDASNFLSKNVGEGLIVAHPSIANWLLSSSGLKVLPVVDENTFKAADLLTTTSFRIVNSYMKVDDWEPFSASKAPLVHVYDGKNFRPLAYLDDSYSRVQLINSRGEEFIESPYGARFLSYGWNETGEKIILSMSFQTPGLIIDKMITLEKMKPTVSIEYYAKTIKEDVTVKGLTLNVYSLPMDTLPSLEVKEYYALMDVEGQKLKIEFSGNISSIAQDRTKDQRYVTCKLNPLDNSRVYGNVKITALNPKPSKEKPWYSSFFDEAKRYGVGYVIIPKEHEVFMKEALPYKMSSLIVKDSFVRFIIRSWGNIFQEAPAYAKVLNEKVYENGRTIFYETAGLHIEKDFTLQDNSLKILYSVQPHKNNTQLIQSTFSIWIDYGRQLVSKNIILKEKNVELTLDSGSFKIHFFGNVSNISVETHPEYGQIRVLAAFQLNPSNDTIGVSISSDKKMIIEYNPTTRPIMKDNDEVTVSTEGGVFEPVKSLKLYTIYRVRVP
ncbi:MAG: hypothetical protein ACP5K8_08550 [Nitrososphaeria archaeon]